MRRIVTHSLHTFSTPKTIVGIAAFLPILLNGTGPKCVLANPDFTRLVSILALPSSCFFSIIHRLYCGNSESKAAFSRAYCQSRADVERYETGLRSTRTQVSATWQKISRVGSVILYTIVVRGVELRTVVETRVGWPADWWT